MSHRSEKIDVRGKLVTVHRGGRGEPLLYLHSALAEATDWSPVLEALAANHDVIAPVHPGFPGSGGLERVDGVFDLVLHYADLMSQFGLRRAHLVGSSLGGWIAAEIATIYPDVAGTLVLVDAAGLWLDTAPMGEVFGGPPGELALRLFHDQQHPIAQMLHAAGETAWEAAPPEEVLLAFHQSNEATAKIAWNPYFHNPALEGRLDRVTAPTLVLWGDDDRLIPRPHGERYRDRIRGSVLRAIPSCGHLPALEQPEALAGEVAAFVRAHPLARG